MDARVTVSNSDDDIAVTCFPLGLSPLAHCKMFLGPRKDTTPSILLSQKMHLVHRELGSHRHLGRVEMRLSKLAFSTAYFTWNRIYTATFKEHRNLIFMQKLLNCVRGEDSLGTRFTGGTKFEHLPGTYYVFNDLKIIVMGNCYDVLRAFLLEPAK